MKSVQKWCAIMALTIVGLIIGLDIEHSLRGWVAGPVSGFLTSYLILTFANPRSFRDGVVRWFTKRPPIWIRLLNVLSIPIGCMILYWSWGVAMRLVPGLRVNGASKMNLVILLSSATFVPFFFMGFGMFIALEEKWKPRPATKPEQNANEGTPSVTNPETKVSTPTPGQINDWWFIWSIGFFTAIMSPVSLAVSLIVIAVGIVVFLPVWIKGFFESIHTDRRLQFAAYSCGGVIIAKAMDSSIPLVAVFVVWGLVGILTHRYVYRPHKNPSVS